jgi:hypothetical protein
METSSSINLLITGNNFVYRNLLVVAENVFVGRKLYVIAGNLIENTKPPVVAGKFIVSRCGWEGSNTAPAKLHHQSVLVVVVVVIQDHVMLCLEDCKLGSVTGAQKVTLRLLYMQHKQHNDGKTKHHQRT